jgi:EAL domain-containing protein (putative c-di-GMP-specific phosphodiesterase class I)
VISGKEPTPEKLDLAQARLELAIESDIHTALQYGGLHLNFQPIVGVNGKIEAFEALMRCTLNSRVIPPSQFIPVAEKTGLIIRLGEWALVQGASYAARLQKEWGHSKVSILFKDILDSATLANGRR